MKKECQDPSEHSEAQTSSLTYIGIDISKATFDVSHHVGQTYHHIQYANTPKGIALFCSTLGSQHHCVMEATGGYHLRLALALYHRGIAVSVINPLVIRRFMQMQLRRVKTDKADAEQIARYAETAHPAHWKPDPATVTQMSQLASMIAMTTRHETALRNQHDAFTLQPETDRTLLRQLKTEIAHHHLLKQKLLQTLVTLARTTYRDAFDAVVSIPGIGQQTASLLVTVTHGFTAFETPKQLIAYLGLSPRPYQSGTSVRGKGHICKMGMGHIRAALYLCSWSAVKHNPACRECYARLRGKGKVAKVALIAVVNKLVRQAFAIAKDNSRFDPTRQAKLSYDPARN